LFITQDCEQDIAIQNREKIEFIVLDSLFQTIYILRNLLLLIMNLEQVLQQEIEEFKSLDVSK
jgi:hypothetical protein